MFEKVTPSRATSGHSESTSGELELRQVFDEKLTPSSSRLKIALALRALSAKLLSRNCELARVKASGATTALVVVQLSTKRPAALRLLARGA